MGLALLAVGCVGNSDAVDVPDATVTPPTIEQPDESDDIAPVTEPPATARPTTTPPTTPATTSTSAPPTIAPPPTTAPPISETPPATTTTPPPPPDPFLRIGDEGDEVSVMQSKLVTLEYLSPGYADGLFDRATADAVIDFQAQYGLVVDGIFGPETDRSLSAAAASVAPDS